MRRADIEVGKTYAANVNFAKGVVVRALELDVEQRHGYGTGSRKSGVRVVVVHPYQRWGDMKPAGVEHVIATRDVEHEWTAEHEQRKQERDAEAERARKRAAAIEDALVARVVNGKVNVNPNGVTLDLDAAESLLGIGS